MIVKVSICYMGDSNDATKFMKNQKIRGKIKMKKTNCSATAFPPKRCMTEEERDDFLLWCRSSNAANILYASACFEEYRQTFFEDAVLLSCQRELDFAVEQLNKHISMYHQLPE